MFNNFFGASNASAIGTNSQPTPPPKKTTDEKTPSSQTNQPPANSTYVGKIEQHLKIEDELQEKLQESNDDETNDKIQANRIGILNTVCEYFNAFVNELQSCRYTSRKNNDTFDQVYTIREKNYSGEELQSKTFLSKLFMPYIFRFYELLNQSKCNYIVKKNLLKNLTKQLRSIITSNNAKLIDNNECDFIFDFITLWIADNSFVSKKLTKAAKTFKIFQQKTTLLFQNFSRDKTVINWLSELSAVANFRLGQFYITQVDQNSCMSAIECFNIAINCHQSLNYRRICNAHYKNILEAITSDLQSCFPNIIPCLEYDATLNILNEIIKHDSNKHQNIMLTLILNNIKETHNLFSTYWDQYIEFNLRKKLFMYDKASEFYGLASEALKKNQSILADKLCHQALEICETSFDFFKNLRIISWQYFPNQVDSNNTISLPSNERFVAIIFNPRDETPEPAILDQQTNELYITYNEPGQSIPYTIYNSLFRRSLNSLQMLDINSVDVKLVDVNTIQSPPPKIVSNRSICQTGMLFREFNKDRCIPEQHTKTVLSHLKLLGTQVCAVYENTDITKLLRLKFYLYRQFNNIEKAILHGIRSLEFAPEYNNESEKHKHEGFFLELLITLKSNGYVKAFEHYQKIYIKAHLNSTYTFKYYDECIQKKRQKLEDTELGETTTFFPHRTHEQLVDDKIIAKTTINIDFTTQDHNQLMHKISWENENLNEPTEENAIILFGKNMQVVTIKNCKISYANFKLLLEKFCRCNIRAIFIENTEFTDQSKQYSSPDEALLTFQNDVVKLLRETNFQFNECYLIAGFLGIPLSAEYQHKKYTTKRFNFSLEKNTPLESKGEFFFYNDIKNKTEIHYRRNSEDEKFQPYKDKALEPNIPPKSEKKCSLM